MCELHVLLLFFGSTLGLYLPNLVSATITFCHSFAIVFNNCTIVHLLTLTSAKNSSTRELLKQSLHQMFDKPAETQPLQVWNLPQTVLAFPHQSLLTRAGSPATCYQNVEEVSVLAESSCT